jgi:hypothetical protein
MLFQRKVIIMSDIDRSRAPHEEGGFTVYPLLDAIIHVMGNGLAALSGYTQLLQKAISTQARGACAPEWEGWHQQHERWLSYVQIMREREILLNDFLNQMRTFSQKVAQEPFNQYLTRVDLMLLLGHLIEYVRTLHQDRAIQAHLSVQPLYVLCDPLWMELTLAHILDHTVEAHTISTPVDIGIKRAQDPVSMLDEASIEIRIQSGLLRQPSGLEDPFELWSRTLNAKDREICSTFCREVLREYGGRSWTERTAKQEEIVSLTLPLAT